MHYLYTSNALDDAHLMRYICDVAAKREVTSARGVRGSAITRKSFTMRLLVEDDGTIEIIEIKIVRVREGDDQAPIDAKSKSNNSIKVKDMMSAVNATSLAAIGVIQLALVLVGLGHFL